MAGGKQYAETTVYSRNAGFDIRQEFVAGGSDGAGNVEFVGLSYPGAADTQGRTGDSAAIWQIRRFFYNSSNQQINIGHAGGNDGFTNQFSARTSLTYSNAP